MFKMTLIAGSAVAVMLLSACATYEDGAYGHRHYSAVGGYDVWYDGAYGPYANGYWGDGDVFMYSDTHGGWIRDDAHHFRHQRWEGSNGFRADHRP